MKLLFFVLLFLRAGEDHQIFIFSIILSREAFTGISSCVSSFGFAGALEKSIFVLVVDID